MDAYVCQDPGERPTELSPREQLWKPFAFHGT